jgi:hypothetical protein
MNKKILYAIAAAVIVLVVVLVCLRSFRSPAKPGFVLRIQPEAVDNQSRLALRFINEGPGDLVIATGELQTFLVKSNDDPDLFCLYMGRTQEEYNGTRRVVLSPHDFKPVEIRPNEELRLNDVSPLLTTLPAGQIKLVAAYEVSKSIGERYAIWHGYIESNAIELTVNRPEEAVENLPEQPELPDLSE